jgi:pyruvate/2-oxoglutarate dehydrogenase complex dihydrolipoamide acyltransferase (E2) component
MSKGGTWLVLAALAGAALLIAPAPYFWRSTAVVQSGPLADRIVLRAVVIAADGVAKVAGPAGADGRAAKVLVREGDSVQLGQELAEIIEGGGSSGASSNRSGAAASKIQLMAPIAGTLLARRVDPGDSLAVASQGGTQALFEIADCTKTAVRAELEERDAGRIAQGFGVTLTTPGARGVIGHGVVARVGARIERRTLGADDARVRADGAVQALFIDWQAPPPRAPIGQRLEAIIAMPAKPAAIRVPRSAVVVREGRTVVETPLLLWSREVPVQVGIADDALAEVRGIEAGSRVFLQ